MAQIEVKSGCEEVLGIKTKVLRSVYVDFRFSGKLRSDQFPLEQIDLPSN